MTMEPAEIIHRFQRLQSERRNLDNVYELISRFVVPGRGRFFRKYHDTEESIEWRRREIYDSTAVMSAQTLAANIHGSLTSPSTLWFHLRFKQDALNDDQAAAIWLEACQDRLWYAIQESNFNLEANELYLDDVSYGTAVMFHEINDDGTFKYRTGMIRGVYFEDDFDGKPIAVYRKRQYTAVQLMDRFGDKVPDHIKERIKNPRSASEKFDVVQAIMLRDDKKDADVSTILPPDERPFEEHYIMEQGKHELLDEPNTYYEMPAYVLRWGRAAGTKFGYSPAINVLSDVLTLNQLVEFTLKAAEKAIDPPLLSRQRGVIGDLDLRPGGNTTVRNPDDVRPLMSGVDANLANLEREKLIMTIRQAFYVDQLSLKDSPAMTATEVQARMELMQRLLGPALSRMQSDYLDPMLKRGFWGLYRNNQMPEMPDVVRANQAELEIEYIGPLARWQKLNEVTATERWLATISQIAAVQPDILDVIDFDMVAKNNAKHMGVPAELIRDDATIEDIRARRAQQQAMQQQVELAGNMAGAMVDGAQAQQIMSETGGLQ